MRNILSPPALLFIVYAVGFALLSSLFHYRSLLKKHQDDYRAFMLYFSYFSVFLLVIPVLFILACSPQPLETLKNYGFRFGDFKLGLAIVLIFLPVLAVMVPVSIRNPKLKDQYPFSKRACRDPKKFAQYEIAYFFLYYLPWEFTFRGVLLFSLSEETGSGTTGVLMAVSVQTIIATVFHLGHPDIEVLGAFVGSVVFGLIAFFTKSFFYGLFIHALLGMANDTGIYLRYYRGKGKT